MLAKNTISAILVVYHEEKIIRRCLESLKGVVDEIIVVHDGECKDRTLEIAREFTDRIFVRPRVGCCNNHHPWAMKESKGEWILLIDADEFLSKELRQKIKTLATDATIDGYNFLWRFWDGEKYITKHWPYKPFLYRKNKMSFIGLSDSAMTTFGKIKNLNLVVEHRPNYNNFTWQVFRTKWMRWIKIRAQNYWQDFSAIEKFNAREKDWSPRFKFFRQHALLISPFAGLYYFLGTLKAGAWREGFWGWKIAVMMGIYYFLLWLQVWKERPRIKI